jgi:hypothetical protein
MSDPQAPDPPFNQLGDVTAREAAPPLQTATERAMLSQAMLEAGERIIRIHQELVDIETAIFGAQQCPVSPAPEQNGGLVGTAELTAWILGEVENLVGRIRQGLG